MPRNRRKHPNNIEVASLTWSIIAAIFLGIAGLSYVSLKNHLHAIGSQIKANEHELFELTAQNELLQTRVSTLSSQKVLQRRLDEDFIKMIPIAEDRIVRVYTPESRSGAGEIRAVSNEDPAK